MLGRFVAMFDGFLGISWDVYGNVLEVRRNLRVMFPRRIISTSHLLICRHVEKLQQASQIFQQKLTGILGLGGGKKKPPRNFNKGLLIVAHVEDMSINICGGGLPNYFPLGQDFNEPPPDFNIGLLICLGTL